MDHLLTAKKSSKHATQVFLTIMLAASALFPQQPSKTEEVRKDFPLVVDVARSDVGIETEPDQALRGAQMGLAPPFFIFVRAAINGESRWQITCRRENPLAEANPCTPLAPGKYPARWVHNGELLQVVVESESGQLIGRFFDISPNRDDPPSQEDEPLQEPRYQFQFSVPEGKHLEDYPFLLHVYGASRLALPNGISPVYTNCTTISYGPYVAPRVSCNSSGGIERYLRFIDLDATLNGTMEWLLSCSGRCSLLGPGFYLARWKDSRRQKLSVLVSNNGKPKEVEFVAQNRPFPDASSSQREVHPPKP